MEDCLVLRGGKSLRGQVKVSGSKNATLPIMAASLLSQDEVILTGVPDLEDVNTMSEALCMLGAGVKREGDILTINARSVHSYELPEDISRRMRASNLVMGSLLARYGEARVAQPGGCKIGNRPVDLHLKGFQALGYDTGEPGPDLTARGCPRHGVDLYLDFPSVGATENLMMAAVTVPGTTLIRNAAREPEIVDLQNFLNRMGARIRGAGLDCIRIEGVKRLGGVEHKVIPDRIEAGTFMAAASITRGDIYIDNVVNDHTKSVIAKFREIGVEIIESNEGVRVMGSRCMRPCDLKTLPFPGFPTDMQPQMMALLSTVPGTSMVVETIFENRYMHVQELRRMGADIKVEGRVAIIQGKNELVGANVQVSDLRAGAALVIAGLFAEGQTILEQIQHIDRGYDNLHIKFMQLGANIQRRLRS